jgi:hypothetical protein
MSELKLSGEIVSISEIQNGTSKAGNEWKKLGFTVTTGGDYPKTCYFTVFGQEKVDNFMKYNKTGQNVEVSFNVESREYNERWYTDLNAWKVFTLKNEGATTQKEEEGDNWKSVSEDLPF